MMSGVVIILILAYKYVSCAFCAQVEMLLENGYKSGENIRKKYLNSVSRKFLDVKKGNS
jgi:hypothetical protein